MLQNILEGPRDAEAEWAADAWNPSLEENEPGLSLDVTMMGRALSFLSQLLCLAELSATMHMFSAALLNMVALVTCGY